MNSRVLVTGASGFIGWHAVKLLIEAEFDVHVSARRPIPDMPAGVTFHPVDLLAAGQSEKLIEATKPSHLLHLAWNADPKAFWNAQDNLAWLAASLALYRSFANAGGARAVFAGSCAEYDWSSPILSERSTALNPGTLYGVCKDALRRVVEKAAINDSVSFAWARVFWLYGPREQPGRLVSDLISGLLAGKEVPCTSGKQRRDFMHVEDVAGALVKLMMGNVSGAVNIGSGSAESIENVVAYVGQLIGCPELVKLGVLGSGGDEQNEIVADSGVLKNDVAFIPKHNLQNGLTDTVAWWRSHSTFSKSNSR